MRHLFRAPPIHSLVVTPTHTVIPAYSVMQVQAGMTNKLGIPI